MAGMLLQRLTDASASASATKSRLGKVKVLAGVLREAEADEVEVVASYLGGSLLQRRTGLGWRSFSNLPAPAGSPSLTVREVDDFFAEIGTLSGTGSQAERSTRLANLMKRATASEQQYLAALATGQLRQGALAGVLLEAIAAASEVPAEVVRRAAMLAGSTPAIAQAALTGGQLALAKFDLRVGVPVQPMLASSAPNVADALVKAGPEGAAVAVEAKLDGIRIQAHKSADQVRVFSRSLDNITARLPQVVAIIRSLAVDTVILDGEALSIDAHGWPRLFQETASSSASATGGGSALLPWFFDVLLLDGEQLIDRALSERREALTSVVPSRYVIDRVVTSGVEQAEDFARQVLGQGHEGVVVKNLGAPYAAGRRGVGWVKVKPVHTLDLVVLAVEWGSGRRRGYLSNIHLGARDPDSGGFTMLGKTFKGMTDQMLAWQTARFSQLEVGREGHVVYLRPEQVVEIAFDGLQRSTRYPGGLALRFARVVRYRDDKTAAEADTIQTVRALASGVNRPPKE